jgi:hypothetical protein
VLVEILDNYPGDEFLVSGADELYSDAIAILELQHRQRPGRGSGRDDFHFGDDSGASVHGVLRASRSTTTTTLRLPPIRVWIGAWAAGARDGSTF